MNQIGMYHVMYSIPVKSFFHLMQGDACEVQLLGLMSSDMLCEEPLLFLDHLLEKMKSLNSNIQKQSLK